MNHFESLSIALRIHSLRFLIIADSHAEFSLIYFCGTAHALYAQDEHETSSAIVGATDSHSADKSAPTTIASVISCSFSWYQPKIGK